jgi:hypothetical protein
MKNSLLYILLVSVTLISCSKDFLNRPSLNNPTLSDYYTNAAQVEGATGLLYNQVWYNWLDKAYHCIGEVYGGNMLTSAGDPNYGNNTYVYFTVQSTDGQDLLAWQAFYQVAGNATVLINTFQQIRNSSNASFIDPGIAEARFIRGVAYFFIARTFGDAPIVSDPVALAGSGDYNLPRYLQSDVLKFALNDMAAAEAGLSATPYQGGRVTKYSAAGMAAKIYLYEGNYDSAMIKANEVISSNQYSLYPSYVDMFTTAKANNNPESLFALQWIAGGYSYANDIQAYAGPAPMLMTQEILERVGRLCSRAIPTQIGKIPFSQADSVTILLWAGVPMTPTISRMGRGQIPLSILTARPITEILLIRQVPLEMDFAFTF